MFDSAMPYIWVLLLVLSVAVEAATFGLVAIWFMPAALVAIVLSVLEYPVYVQWIAFFGTAAFLLLISKTVLKRYFRKKPPVRTNADAVIGKVGVVTQRIDNTFATGEVKVGGVYWTARASEKTNGVIEEGQLVVVDRIEGVKLICSIKQ